MYLEISTTKANIPLQNMFVCCEIFIELRPIDEPIRLVALPSRDGFEE